MRTRKRICQGETERPWMALKGILFPRPGVVIAAILAVVGLLTTFPPFFDLFSAHD